MVVLRADEEEFSMETRDASPAHLLIKIESFSLLSQNGIREYESGEFEAGGHKWKLIIYPDGDETERKGDHISVHLSMVDTDSLPGDWVVNATCTIFLLNQILDNYVCFGGKVRRFHAMNTKWRFPKLLSKKSLTDPSNGYLIDDNCVFGAEVSVIKGQRVIEHLSILKVTKPFKHNLVISHFSKLEDVWTSEELIEGDYRWKLSLYPNGNGSGKGRCVSIYLACVNSTSFSPHVKVKADVCISMKNKNYDKHCKKNFSHWFSSSAPSWGCAEFIMRGDVCDPNKGFVIDDRCLLETKISIKDVVRDALK